MKKHKGDRHPHFAGVRHGGHNAARKGGKRPPSVEFSADEEAAMRGAPAGGSAMPPKSAPKMMASDGDADDLPMMKGAGPAMSDNDADDMGGM